MSLLQYALAKHNLIDAFGHCILILTCEFLAGTIAYVGTYGSLTQSPSHCQIRSPSFCGSLTRNSKTNFFRGKASEFHLCVS